MNKDFPFSECEKIANELITMLQYNIIYDLSDLGNEIGFIIKAHVDNTLGFEEEDFLNGIKHGLNLKK